MAGKRKVYGYLRLIPREQFTKKNYQKGTSVGKEKRNAEDRDKTKI